MMIFCIIKFISKIQVNRLRPMLTRMIDQALVAFVPNRWIAENIILAQEVVHSFKKMGKKRGYLRVKLDLQKTYDWMEWKFMISVLKAFGFSDKTLTWCFILRSIASTKQLIARWACILVGNGNSIRTWDDPWFPNLPHFIPIPKEDANANNALIVSQLFTQDKCSWDSHKSEGLFDDVTINHIQKYSFHYTSTKINETLSSLGEFSVKVAYLLYRSENPPSNQDPSKGKIWKTHLHERFKTHLWRIAANCLPTKEFLCRFISIRDSTCPLCKTDVEFCLHLFALCPFAKVIYIYIYIYIIIGEAEKNSS